MAKNNFLLLILMTSILMGGLCNDGFAAVGCSLRDPDRDVKRIFSRSTGYKTRFITILERGGRRLQKKIEEKLGDRLEPIYETIDVPYAFYTVLQGKKTMGYIHGVNQKGEFGGLQLILATDPSGTILSFYYQKISSPESKKFRDPAFTDQFKGLTLADFSHYNPVDRTVSDILTPLAGIKNPGKRNDVDFQATLRGLKKNLIIFEKLMRSNLYGKVQKKSEKIEKK